MKIINGQLFDRGSFLFCPYATRIVVPERNPIDGSMSGVRIIERTCNNQCALFQQEGDRHVTLYCRDVTYQIESEEIPSSESSLN